VEHQPGTVTIVVAEGRRMMRLAGELAPETFTALLEEYHGLLRQVLESMGGREVDFDSDTAMAAFPTPKHAALAAVAAQRAVAAHDWPHGRELAMSVGLDSGKAGDGWDGPATARCEELCDAAEGGQIFMTQAVSSQLESEELGDLWVRDLGEVPLRRSDRKTQAYELVLAPGLSDTR
jgi:class 3 adenylate cyclase